MLKSIIIVTITVLQLGPVETAYNEYLDYQTVEQGTLASDVVAVWDTPAMVGRPYILMQPITGEPVYLRFVQDEATEGYSPMTTFGWNATEILVKDPAAVEFRLRESPFEIIGPTKPLWDAPDAPVAMQALDPADHVLYLTWNGQFEINAFVDRTFIMVVGGPSMDSFRGYYGDKLGLPVGDAMPFNISVISNAQGLPPETTYPLAVAPVSNRFLIELDEYPFEDGARPIMDGHIPPGIAMVSFEVEDLDALDVEWRASPASLPGRPYDGRRAGVTAGPAGEWLEIIELD